MSQVVEISVSLGFWIVIILANISFFFLTRVIKIEHDEFPTQWEEDGKPHGAPFWFPMKELRESGFGSDPWSKGYRWLFKTPDWVKTHEKASQMFSYYRFTQYAVLFLLFAMIVILFTSMPK